MPEAPPLAGLRLLERASSLAATYAGFLLSEIGAEVVKVETAGVARPTPGDHVLARGKRSVALDAPGWRELLGRVDAVLTDDSAPPPDPDPDLVRCRVSAWGRTRSRLPPEEALLAAATGVQALVRSELEPVFATRSTTAWVETLRAADVPCGAVGSRADFLRDPEARPRPGRARRGPGARADVAAGGARGILRHARAAAAS